MAEPTHDEHLTQIRDRSRRLAEIPLETSASNRVMRDMIDSIGDVRWLLEQLDELDELDRRRAQVTEIGNFTVQVDLQAEGNNDAFLRFVRQAIRLRRGYEDGTGQ